MDRANLNDVGVSSWPSNNLGAVWNLLQQANPSAKADRVAPNARCSRRPESNINQLHASSCVLHVRRRRVF